MPRTLRNGLLLLLFILFCVVWLSSLWVGLSLYRYSAGTVRSLSVHDGRLIYSVRSPDRDHPYINHHASGWGAKIERHIYGPTWPKWNEWMGFGKDSSSESVSDAPNNGHIVWFWEWRRWWIPLWPLLILSAIPMLLRVHQSLRLSRQVRAQSAASPCPQCGYDLRATPKRCPECGYRL
jgi:hypothetical protein